MRSHDYITQIQLLLTYSITGVRSPNEKAEAGVFTTGVFPVDRIFKTLAHPIWLGESAGNYMVWFAGMVANDTGKSTDQD